MDAKRGRPTKYDPRLCDELPDLFESGESVAEVCVKMGIGRTTFYEWVGRHERFREAYELGQLKAEACWMRAGREAALSGRSICVPIWIFNMKNRYGWADRKVDKDEGVSPEEFARKAHDALMQMERADLGEDSMD